MSDAAATDDEGGAGVRWEPDAARFTLTRGGHVAELVTEEHPGRLVLVHTEVPGAMAGAGVGGQLVQAAIEHARAGGLVLVPRCPFARRWIDRHPEAAAGVELDLRRP